MVSDQWLSGHELDDRSTSSVTGTLDDLAIGLRFEGDLEGGQFPTEFIERHHEFRGRGSTGAAPDLGGPIGLEKEDAPWLQRTRDPLVKVDADRLRDMGEYRDNAVPAGCAEIKVGKIPNVGVDDCPSGAGETERLVDSGSCQVDAGHRETPLGEKDCVAALALSETEDSSDRKFGDVIGEKTVRLGAIEVGLRAISLLPLVPR